MRACVLACVLAQGQTSFWNQCMWFQSHCTGKCRIHIFFCQSHGVSCAKQNNDTASRVNWNTGKHRPLAIMTALQSRAADSPERCQDVAASSPHTSQPNCVFHGPVKSADGWTDTVTTIHPQPEQLGARNIARNSIRFPTWI